ncbi:protein phosphatase 1 regulatory subunit 1C isoform 2-T2 [Discoglossus pictus]
MEPNSPKKIQFAVPLFQSQLDPEASEQIRKRRPTPASLVILNDHSPPERVSKAEEAKCIQRTVHERYCSGSDQAHSFNYNDKCQSSSKLHQQIVAENDDPPKKPRRKDTPYHLEVPFIPGIKQMKSQNESSFTEEGENDVEEEECDH